MWIHNWVGLIRIHMVDSDHFERWLQKEFPEAVGESQTFFSGGTPVRVFSEKHVIQPELRGLVARESTGSALEVFVGKTKSSLAVGGLEALRRGILGGQHANRYFISIERDCGNLFVFDAQTRRAFWGLRDLRPEWHVSSPLRQILHIDVALRGGTLLHGAMIGDKEKCVVIAGPSHAGKSTATAWAVAAGFLSGGDDYASVFSGPGGWAVSTVYQVVKLRDTSPALGSLDFLDHVRIPEEDRTVFYLDSASRLPETDTIPLHAIITLGPAEQDAPIQRISATEALTKLAPSTLLQASFFEKEILERLTRLSAEIPAFRIRRPSSKQQLADVLSRVFGKKQDELREPQWS